MRQPRLALRVVSLMPLLALFASPAYASGERQLVEAINDYRAHPQRCDRRPAQRLAPLSLKSNLALPIGYGGGLRDRLKASGYAAVTVRTLRVVGAQDADEAFDLFQDEYCGALLDNQYADIGVSRARSEWQIVLAQPVLDSRVGDSRATSKGLLAQVNAARAKSRMCGRQRYPAARPLSWNPALGAAAQGHSKAMAYGNYFAHRDPDGDGPADRARAAGYRGRQIGENIAAGQSSPGKAMAGWLASPGHCANLMNPMFTQVGAAYAADARSDEGVYWTMMFGAP
ncbi:MAG: CAP domain-containing protein [Gammaproteobacteria bacterium]|nr:CAP domain-containing protein [Gammaproteobacteria bacterium]MBU0819224.1 CAP domain-containing protein [Gammaproteobacteria bacterium]MBU0842585.1 CAP domain-containing protein [Gammaproteobacteria bacterium]MBU1840919.1 CAP domain-containing protein [Gammaproteobacteria bacterium]